jgi:ABC-type sugar transport system permease subunit
VTLTLVPVLLSLLLGLGIAIPLDRKVFGRGLLRTLIISQFLVMPAAAALVWKFTLLDTEFGLINWVLSPFGLRHTDWINDHAKETIITVLTWQWTPFMVLILLAAVLHSFERAAELFAGGLLDPEIFISHRLLVGQYAQPLEKFRTGQGRKIQVQP